MSDLAVVACPSCSQAFRIESARIGEQARCGICGTSFRIEPESAIQESVHHESSPIHETEAVDEATVMAWMDEALPAVAGAASVNAPTPTGEPTPSGSGIAGSGIAGSGIAEDNRATAAVRLTHIDEDGAHFEFLAALLSSEPVRTAFPQACVGCGTTAALTVYLIRWQDRIGNEAGGSGETSAIAVGELAELEAGAGFGTGSNARLLTRLPELHDRRPPFHLPYPIFACPRCRPDREITGRVIRRSGQEACRLSIAALPTAVAFFSNSGGADTPEFQQLVEARDRQHQDWRSLDAGVRDRITHWFTPRGEERFMGFHRDTETPAADTGISGIVLTNRRLVYQRLASRREFPLDANGRLEIRPAGTTANIRIFEEENRPAAIKIAHTAADELATRLRTLGCAWTIVR